MSFLVKLGIAVFFVLLAFGVSTLSTDKRDAGMDQLFYWGMAVGALYYLFTGE